jgi:hypothetical protein
MGHAFSLGREAEFSAMGKLLTLIRRASLEDATDEEIIEYVTSLPPGQRWSAERAERALETLRMSRIVLASELAEDTTTLEYYEMPGCRLLLAEEASSSTDISETASEDSCFDTATTPETLRWSEAQRLATIRGFQPGTREHVTTANLILAWATACVATPDLRDAVTLMSDGSYTMWKCAVARACAEGVDPDRQDDMAAFLEDRVGLPPSAKNLQSIANRRQAAVTLAANEAVFARLA